MCDQSEKRNLGGGVSRRGLEDQGWVWGGSIFCILGVTVRMVDIGVIEFTVVRKKIKKL